MAIKLFHSEPSDSLGLALQAIAYTAEVELDITWGCQQSDSPNGRLPFIETDEGEKVCETLGIIRYITSKSSVEHNLYGKGIFEHCLVEQWIAWFQTTFRQHYHQVVWPFYGVIPYDPAKYNANMKIIKDLSKRADAHLKNSAYFAGAAPTAADFYLLNVFKFVFGTVFDAGFRKAIPNLTKWFQTMTQHPTVLKFYGAIKMTEKVLKPVATAPVAAVKPAAEEKDDMDDLFGDDDDEEAAAAAKKAAEAAKEKAKGKKEKKKEIEQSLVMFEIKPLDSDTNLDEVAKRIFALKREGVFWKTEYKKEPVAFGIFKLIIGVTVIDEIASVDELQEAMEAMEDMVQSVEITAFTKI